MGLAVWQGVRLSDGGELPIERSVKPGMRSTNHGEDRDEQARKKRLTTEPVAAFFERAKRGMTEQEIRWMISDFEAMQVLPASGDLVEPQYDEKKLKEWRLQALDEALSLSPEQKRDICDSLNQNELLEWSVSFPMDKVETTMPVFQRNIRHANFFDDGNSWNHSSLREDQIQLTYKKSLEAKYEERDKAINNGGSISCHREQLMLVHELKSGEYIEYPSPSFLNSASSVYGTISGGIINISNTFPLTPDQQLERHRNDILAQAKLLHPAQLRMALLNPGVAGTLKHELDKPRE